MNVGQMVAAAASGQRAYIAPDLKTDKALYSPTDIAAIQQYRSFVLDYNTVDASSAKFQDRGGYVGAKTYGQISGYAAPTDADRAKVAQFESQIPDYLIPKKSRLDTLSKGVDTVIQVGTIAGIGAGVAAVGGIGPAAASSGGSVPTTVAAGTPAAPGASYSGMALAGGVQSAPVAAAATTPAGVAASTGTIGAAIKTGVGAVNAVTGLASAGLGLKSALSGPKDIGLTNSNSVADDPYMNTSPNDQSATLPELEVTADFDPTYIIVGLGIIAIAIVLTKGK